MKSNVEMNGAGDNNQSKGKSEFDMGMVKRRQEFADHMLRKQNDFIANIFPNQVDKAITQYQSELVKQRGDQNLEINRVVGQFQLNAMIEVANNLMIKGASWLDADAKENFMQTHMSLRKKLVKIREEYTQVIDASFDRLKTIKNDRLRQRTEELLFTEIDTLFDLFAKTIIDHKRHAENAIS